MNECMGVGNMCEHFVLPINALHGRGTENVTKPVDLSQLYLLAIPNLE